MQINLHDLIVNSATEALSLQHKKGYFPKGHDGPWYYQDTFLRTTSHWVILFLKVFDLTGRKEFLDSATKGLNYLLSKEARPHSSTFHCRNASPYKDQSNGLIGQAWVIEALIFAGQIIKDEKYLKTANSVLKLLPYSYIEHSWMIIDIDGREIEECKTLNQQIWLASNALNLGFILLDDTLKNHAIDFFYYLHNKVTFYHRGLIKHNYTQSRSFLKEKASQAYWQIKKYDQFKFQQNVSKGYLPFLLYGIASAIDKTPNATFWKEAELGFLKKALNYVEKKFPYGLLEDPDSFRWGYNPVGIEMAYIYQVILDNPEIFNKYYSTPLNKKLIDKWLETQLKFYFDFNKNLLVKNTNDPDILASRLYEAVRLNNYRISVFH